jgi:hypothetical protein
MTRFNCLNWSTFRCAKRLAGAMCGRLLVGKNFFDLSILLLVGAAMCPAFNAAFHNEPLAIMLSADRGPIHLLAL